MKKYLQWLTILTLLISAGAVKYAQAQLPDPAITNRILN